MRRIHVYAQGTSFRGAILVLHFAIGNFADCTAGGHPDVHNA